MKNLYDKFLCTLLIGLISAMVMYLVNGIEHAEPVANLEITPSITTSTVNTTTATESTTTTYITTTQITSTTSETVTTTSTMTSTSFTLETESTVESTTEAQVEQSFGETYLGTYEATWYCAVDMGYTSQPYGSSGRSLASGYSIASNSIPAGSLVKISGGGLDGVYRVDDCGGMANNVIDFYYWDRSCVPSDFLSVGRVSVEVYLVE